MTVSLAKPLGLEFVENAAAWQKKTKKNNMGLFTKGSYRIDIERGLV